jgi:hypothetical protein
MKRRFGSFLIRYWLLAQDKQLIKAEHIQSGKEIRVNTIKELMNWIAAQVSSSLEEPAETKSQGDEDSPAQASNG